jgi:hypothetical protein
MHDPSIEYDHDIFSGDIAPGSLDSPSMLPKAQSKERETSLFRAVAVLFRGDEAGKFGYEGKEGELRRPTGMRHWSQSLGGFRR